MKAVLKGVLGAMAVVVFAVPAWSADAIRHAVILDIDPAHGRVKVTDSIAITGEGRLTLALDDVFVITALSVDGQTQSAPRGNGLVSVDLGAQGQHTLDIAYAADLKVRTEPSGPPFLNADGGFFSGDWLVSADGRDATWAIVGETPAGQKWITPGTLTQEGERNGRYTATIVNDRADEPPVLITGPFTVSEKKVGGVRVRTYFHPELAALADGYLDGTARYISDYAKTVGDYPYGGFAIVSGPAPVGFGLPGMTYIGRQVLALPFIRTTSLPHEVLHNWWGNAVKVDYGRGNWAEGLTTYMADHAQAASREGDGGRNQRLEWLRNYAALPSDQDAPVLDFISKTHDASQVVGYNKVAFIFHMLKARLGQATFDNAIRRFYADNRFKTAGWKDIEAAFETASGQSLDTFFTAWLTRAGAPELALTDVAVDGGALAFTLTQTQEDAPFPLALSAKVTTAKGEHVERLDMSEKRQHFRIALDATPQALAIDPDFDAFRRLSAAETPPILRDVTLSTDTRLVAPGPKSAQAIARTLAAGLLQAPARESVHWPDTVPVIVAGLESDVAAILRKNGIQPPALDTKAEASAYVLRDANGRAVLVAQAKSEAGLEALARALPHYKRKSFALVHGDRVTDSGVWPAPPGPLAIRLDE